MAFKHGKATVVTLNGVDYSAFADTTDFDDGVDTHETTTYGRNRKTYLAGLGDGKVSVGGMHSDSVNNPRSLFKPLMAAGTEVQFVYRPEGTGVGKPQSRVNVIVSSYKDSSPVGDVVKWTAELQMTGDLDETPQ